MSEAEWNGVPMGTTAVVRRAGRVLVTGVVSATTAGLLAGVPARILMRLVATAAGEATHFSWVGSIGIVAIFAVAMLPGALVAAATARRIRWLAPAAGAALLCIPATGVASTELGSTGGHSLLTWAEAGAAGLAVYVCIAALPVITLRIVNRF